jgi:molybdopterin molybdotransferase
MIGLPGHPASALSNFYIFISPILDKMLGIHKRYQIIKAKLTRKVVSTIGRYEFLPVALEHKDGENYATPVLRGSSAITTLASADGFIEILENIEVIEKNEIVRVKLF